jgi:hypothetical protein
MSGGQYLSLPAAATGLAPISGASAWAFGSWVTAVSPLPIGIRIVGITFQTTYKPATDTTNEIFLEIGIGKIGSEITKIQVPYSQRKGTALGYFQTEIYNMFFPEPYLISGGNRVAVRITDNVASALTYSGVKIFYIEDDSPTVVLGDPPDYFDGTDTTPELRFTGTDINGNALEYEIQADSVNTFNSTPKSFDIEALAFDNNQFSDATNLINCYGFCFSDDGMNIYACDNISPYHVNQYSLGTAWDVSTMAFASKYLNFGAIASTPEGIRFKPNGLTCYVFSNTTSTIYQFTLSVAWDISTATSASKSFTLASYYHSIWFNDDGYRFYALDRTLGILKQYHMTTGWDISTAVYDQSFNFTDVAGLTTCSFVMSASGTRLFVNDTTSQRMFQYILTAAWDISTLVYDGISYYDSTAFTTYAVMSASTDGTKFFICSTANTIFCFNTGNSGYYNIRSREYNNGFQDATDYSATHPFVSGHLMKFIAQGDIEHGSYYWRVRAKDPAGSNQYGAWSASKQFDLWETQTVALNSPADTSSSTNTNPSLVFTGSNVWNQDLDYQIQIDTVNTFDSKESYTGLKAGWSMDGADITNGVLAEPVNGLNATVYGSLPVSGIKGDALVMNGTSDYLSASNTGLPTTGQAFTISVWVWDDTTGVTLASGYHRIVCWSNGTAQIQLGIADGDSTAWNRKFYIVDNSSTAKVASNGNATNGWHHVVATCNGSGTYHLYVDGIASESGSLNGSGNTYNGDSTHIFIGQRGDNYGYVTGQIDETRIYNRELTAIEALNLYNQNAAIGRFSLNDTGFADSNPVSVTNAADGYYYSGGVSGDTGYINPRPNSLYLMTVASRTGITTDPVQPTVTGCGLTWVAINSIVHDTTSSSRRRVTLFRAMGSSPTAGVLTIDFASQAQTNFGWIIDVANGIDTSGTNGSGAIIQSATAIDSSEAVATLTATLGAFSNSGNATYGAIGTGAFGNNPPVTTQGAGFTLVFSNTFDGGNTCHTLFKNTNDTTVEITFDQVNSIGIIAVELKAKTLGRPYGAGNQVTFTVQAGDALAPGTYYWRARAIDTQITSYPGAGIYGAYSAINSFTITAAAAGIKTINGLAKASIKLWNGLANASVKNLQ